MAGAFKLPAAAVERMMMRLRRVSRQARAQSSRMLTRLQGSLQLLI
jgi:hypothetical protein